MIYAKRILSSFVRRNHIPKTVRGQQHGVGEGSILTITSNSRQGAGGEKCEKKTRPRADSRFDDRKPPTSDFITSLGRHARR